MLDWGRFLLSGFCPPWVWPCHQNSGDCFGSLPGLDSVPMASLPCPHLSGPAISYLCWAGLGGRSTRHLPLCLPQTTKRRQMPKKEENKSQARHRRPAASMAIAETYWQKSFPVCATGSSLELFAKVGSGFACLRWGALWLHTQESCGTAGSRSQVLTMIISLNHNNIFFLIRVLQNPTLHLSLTFPF